ncbi:MAG: right-handed parallel beta-helix repeat-containing protein [Candidatus Hydrogenedentes bacterium]|nr:right-handed parallel beta-helix repeat-containing protein [Candidatus Hydrogenedentota bacterium]
MFRIACLLILAPAVSGLATAAPLVFHVHPEGADGALTTLAQARDAIRASRDAGVLPDGAEVRVHGGDYLLSEPLTLGGEDSGTADAPIRYIADPATPARLLGGRLVSGFAPVADPAVLARIDDAARDHVLQLDLKALGITDYGSPKGGGLELFFNGKRMTLSRWPNEGFVNIADIVVDDGHKIHGIPGSLVGRFTYEDERPARWLDEPDPWLHGYWFWDWSDERQPIAAIDTENKTITVQEPYHNYGYRKGQWYYAYNLLAELDRPGEWFLDREAGLLYFWPPSDPTGAEIMLTLLPNLIVLEGASHVTFQGFTLEGMRNTAAIVREGEGVRLNALTIRNGGGSAISVSGGRDHGVQACNIHGMGAAGISISGGDRNTLEPAGHFAINNHIHHFAEVYRVYNAGIHVQGVGNRVAHNYIHDAPHMAIGFGGNDHLIEYNEIHDVCLESNDAGALYTGRNWTMRGHVIRYNHLYNINGFRDHGSVGVYLDDMFSSAEIYGNLFRNVYRAAFIGGGRDCTVENNIFINCTKALHIDARALGWAHQHADDWIAEAAEKGTISGIAYKKPPYSERYPKLVNILENEPKAPVGNLVARNIFVGEGWKDVEDKADPYIEYKDNLADADPMFVDPENGDYRLKPESPARGLGFEEIPFEKIGLYKDDLRTTLPDREN